MPDYAYVHKAYKIRRRKSTQDHNPNPTEPQNCCPQEEQNPKSNVVNQNNNRIPNESKHQPSPNLRDDADNLPEGDFLGRVNAGDGVDDGGRGKEREDEKESEVGSLEEPKTDPLRRDHIRKLGVVGRILGGRAERVFVIQDLEEQELGYLDVSKEDD